MIILIDSFVRLFRLCFQIFIIIQFIIMYQDLEAQQDTIWGKIRRSLYLIVSVTLLTHTISVVYSVMAFRQQSVGFISIIVSSCVCFFISSSHLTIYGISILGCLYLSMLRPYYSMNQLCYIVAIGGIINFPLWKMIHSIGSIFHCLPGRIHASMVLGISLIVLSKFFPLAIQNINAFFEATNQSPLTNPLDIISLTFSTFNVLTLGLTGVCIFIMFLLRQKLAHIPCIAILIIIGIIINWTKVFLSFEDLCTYTDVDCTFYILNTANLIQPKISEIIQVIPASLVMTVVITFQQFLYLEQFQRRGKRFQGQGNLGDIKTESKVLAIGNIISGCLGGLPICINMFATYQNYAFNQRYGFKGTKWVGLMQIPVSYCLYSFLSVLYERIPLFILFTVIATPTIYFLKNILAVHSKHLLMIFFIAALNVLTHPLLALVFASLVSIYDIAQLLKPAPAQLIVQGIYVQGQRQSSTFAKIVEKEATKQNVYTSQFINRIQQIQDDIPSFLQGKSYIMYRFVGSVSYLNNLQNIQELKRIVEKHFGFDSPNFLVLSFRYSQIVDQQSLEQLSFLVKQFRSHGVKVLLTGLHLKLMQKMELIGYFAQMLKEDQKCMYSLHVQ